MEKTIQKTQNNKKPETQRGNYNDEKRVSAKKENKKNPCDGCYGASNNECSICVYF